ncbi:MAG: tRNA epoxyqueuosine(34) reductase QueG [Thermomicrobia bacterium]|nr:tRNA epoxyqueuosine(34) reductase QueG [Thermomicrobia bacterium]MCA1722749.1 tRNA epoxyqueuosine(34) reductase QueG [Thermomicrobia bacterium]
MNATDIKALALAHGFHLARVTTAEPFVGLEPVLNARIAAGHLGGLDWFTPERAHIASAPQRLLPWARSLLVLGVSYYADAPLMPDDGVLRGRIARYAWGADYHDLLKAMMRGLIADIERLAGTPLMAGTLVDTARIVDRAAAARAGLGWYGKNTCIITTRDTGSYLFLAEVPLDLDLEPDAPLRKSCGSCAACMAACPTHAIPAAYVLDTPRCISYLTIEHRGALPVALRPQMGSWVFGCDLCQEVCPPNRHVLPLAPPALQPRDVDDAYPALIPLLTMTVAEYRDRFRGRAIKRAKREGLARNAAVALGNSGDRAAVPALAAALADHDAPLIRSHAAWALGHLGGKPARAALERCRATEPDTEVCTEIVAALGNLNSP